MPPRFLISFLFLGLGPELEIPLLFAPLLSCLPFGFFAADDARVGDAAWGRYVLFILFLGICQVTGQLCEGRVGEAMGWEAVRPFDWSALF